jgi:hypothetical protein
MLFFIVVNCLFVLLNLFRSLDASCYGALNESHFFTCLFVVCPNIEASSLVWTGVDISPLYNEARS